MSVVNIDDYRAKKTTNDGDDGDDGEKELEFTIRVYKNTKSGEWSAAIDGVSSENFGRMEEAYEAMRHILFGFRNNRGFVENSEKGGLVAVGYIYQTGAVTMFVDDRDETTKEQFEWLRKRCDALKESLTDMEKSI